jgi:ATP-binding cassette subfamily F protein 2
MSKRYNEKRAALAIKAIDKELDGGYGRENFEANAAKDARGAAMGEGEDELFEKKLSKAEKKAAAKAAREAKRKKKGLDKKPKKNKDVVEKEGSKLSPEEVVKKSDAILNDPNATAEQKKEAVLEKLSAEQIVVTYESRKTKMHANARNINVSGVTVTFHGKPLIEETNLVINYGNRYGFIGPNGSGKVRWGFVSCRVVSCWMLIGKRGKSAAFSKQPAFLASSLNKLQQLQKHFMRIDLIFFCLFC